MMIKESSPIKDQVVSSVKMPQIEKLSINVKLLSREIFMLEFPYIKELKVKIDEASPNFTDCVIALSKNLIKKGSILKIEAMKDKMGIKKSSFKKILKENPQANVEIKMFNEAKNDIVLELL